ncbi:PREDICTED: probable E3 ubiquitin-protein ligase MARCH10 [Elephantulus edwardii]|uniref:probable E3 ubiquitin-protein ligase MARCH10 n=1 Tax=Elephantulus edwardii TaxID=28737 RepID=UPI0003F0C37A|nr:PREDICTED: probable E3 ubiquitin-protein ligase MARCH10 [Elephantulus edwardii]
MLHEAQERQKFISEAQYLRDMQHKADSDYQACLRRQEYKRDSFEKKQEQLRAQEPNPERCRFPSGSSSSSRQSVAEEDLVTEPGLSAKTSLSKCDSKLPAIDQTSSVKQKHKSTMTPKKSEKAGPSKPSPAAQAPQILSRKRRPNLGRLTVSPEMQSAGASEDHSRQKLQLPMKVLPLRGADPVGPMWANDTTLKRPVRDRRNLVPCSQLMLNEYISGRTNKGNRRPLSQMEPHSALPRTFQSTDSPRVLRGSMGPPITSTTMRGQRRAPFRFRDEDFYSIISSNSGGESYDTEEETHVEEELLSVGMHPPRSPSIHKRSRFLETLATHSKNKTLEEDSENCRANSFSRSELSHGSLKASNAGQPVTEQPSVGLRMFQDSGLHDGESVKETDSGGSENKAKSVHSGDIKSEPSQEDDLNAENEPKDCTSVASRPRTHCYERDWQDFLNNPGHSFNRLPSSRQTALRSSANSAYTTPGSLMCSAVRDLSMASSSIHSSNSEGNSRFHIRRPLSPIRNRHLLARAEDLSDFPVNNTRAFCVREAEDNTLTSQPQGAPLSSGDSLLNPQGVLSSEDSSSVSESEMSLQDQLPVPGPLQENIALTFFPVSALPNPNIGEPRMAVSRFLDEKKDATIKADPENLKKLQESLLEEDSEEEGDLCRICQIAGGSPTNPLLEPCGCVGSLQFVHQECLKKWLQVKITSGADLSAVKTCEMCKEALLVDLEDLNMNEFYQKYQQSWAHNELMNSSLYLVLLLHFYEQHFAELMRLNYNWIIRERLSRNYLPASPEENQNSELGDGNEGSVYQSNGRVI